MTPARGRAGGRRPRGHRLRARTATPSGARSCCVSVYAPPCVEPFDGDNGGATSPGVTADEIKIVLLRGRPRARPADGRHASSRPGPTSTPTRPSGRCRATSSMYNKLFETYGRTVVVERYTGTGAGDDVEKARADAIAIAEKEPFAVIGGPAAVERRVRRRAGVAGHRVRAQLRPGASPRTSSRSTSPTCGRRCRRPTRASWRRPLAIGTFAGPGNGRAGGRPGDARPGPRVRPGALRQRRRRSPAGVRASSSRQLAASTTSSWPPTSSSQLDLARGQENARTNIAKLKDAGVTTIIYYGDPITPGPLTKEATAQGYWPEWILGPSLLMDTTDLRPAHRRRAVEERLRRVDHAGPGAPRSRPTPIRIYEWAYGEEAAPQRLPHPRAAGPHHLHGHPHGRARPDARDVPRRRCGALRRPAAGPPSAAGVAGRPRRLAGLRLGRQRRRHPHLVGPDGHRRGRDRQRGRRDVPLRQGRRSASPTANGPSRSRSRACSTSSRRSRSTTSSRRGPGTRLPAASLRGDGPSVNEEGCSR